MYRLFHIGITAVCIVSALILIPATAVYAEYADMPIDQYLHFSSDDPGTAHAGIYKTGLWEGINHYLLFKPSDITAFTSLPPGSQIRHYMLVVQNPVNMNSFRYITRASIWLNCTDPQLKTYADIPSCAVYPQTVFEIHMNETIEKIFDYSPVDAFTHWIMFTGQETGMEINPASLRWRIIYDPPPPTSTPEPPSGDANGDFLVDESDYAVWESFYTTNYGQNTVNGPSDGDFNGDSVVTGADYVIWLNNYGS